MNKIKIAPFDGLVVDSKPATTPPPNPITAVSEAIKHALRSKADPYVLAGCMVEGIAMTLLAGIPAEKQANVANDLLLLLYARLDSLNMIEAPRPDDSPRTKPATRH
ncbi:MAG: hypothetical protein JSS43_15460 [Proteobacteria bacterium]|nr:hypothetical protein [Pseudomonadota bacterium]